MSSRTRSEFGSLGQRVAGVEPVRAHVWVDGELPGVLVQWRRTPQCWVASVAYVVGGRLVVEEVTAARVQPAGIGGPS